MFKNEDLWFFEIEVVVFFEECFGGVVSRIVGYDVLWYYDWVFGWFGFSCCKFFDFVDMFGLDLEEGFVWG